MTRKPVGETFRRLRVAMTGFREAYERSRRATHPPLAAGGRITGLGCTDGSVPVMLSRGHVALPRAAYDAVGIDAISHLNSRDGFPAHRPDVTIVEPDGSLTEIEGSGP